MPTHQQYQDNGSNTTQMTLTLQAGATVGDTIFLVHSNNFYTTARLGTPTGTAVSSWTLEYTFDGGTNDHHAKIWKGTVANASGTIIENNAAYNDEERYFGYFLFPGTVALDDALGAETDVSGTTATAPSVTPDTGFSDDELICIFGSRSANVNFTSVPTGMTAFGVERDTGFATYQAFYQALSSDAATVAKTCTFTGSNESFGLSFLVKSVAPPLPLDTYSSAGSSAWVTGTTSVAPTYPASLLQNDIVYAIVHNKASTVTPTTPANWNLVGTAVLGSGTLGVGTGSTRCTVFERVVPSGGLTGSQSITVTAGDTSQACMVAFRPTNATSVWEAESVIASAIAAASITPTHNITVTAGKLIDGDFVVWLVGTADDTSTNISHTSISCTGATFAASTRTPNATSASATGNDIAAAVFQSEVTAGPNTGTTLAIVSNITASETSGAFVFVPRCRTTTVATEFFGDATLTAVASLDSAGVREKPATAALSATASLTSAGEENLFALASLTAVSNLATAAGAERFGIATLNAAVSLTSTAIEILSGSVGLNAVAALNAVSIENAAGTALLNATAALSADGTPLSIASAPLAASATLTASAQGLLLSSVSLSAIAQLVSAASADRTGASALSAVAALQIAASQDRQAVALLTTAASLGPVSGLVVGQGAVSLSAIPLLSSSVNRNALSTIVMLAVSELQAGASATRFATALLDTSATLFVSTAGNTLASATLTAVASFQAQAVETLFASAILNAISTLTAGTFRDSRTNPVSLTTPATLVAGTSGAQTAAATLAALATLLSEGVVTDLGAASLTVVPDLATLSTIEAQGAASLSTSSFLVVEEELQRLAAVNLVTQALLSATGEREVIAPLIALIAQAELIAEVAVAIISLPIKARGPILQELFRANLNTGNYRSKLKNDRYL